MPAILSVRDLMFARPVHTSQGTIGLRRVWVLAVGDGSGLTGYGEAAPLPLFGGEKAKDCAAALEQAVAILDDTFIATWLDRARPDAPLGALERVLAATPCARSAVEGALLDLLAKLHGVPLAELLSPQYSPWIPVNALVSGNDQLGAADAAVQAGFRTVKMKLSPDHRLAANQVKAMRARVAKRIALRADANGAWTAEQALAFASEIGPDALEYLEQPLPAADLDRTAQLRRRAAVKIALDESARVPADVGRIGTAQAADVVVLKPMLFGGWRPIRQAVQLAKSCGLGIVLSSTLDGAIGRAHATHMAAALGLDQQAHGLATGDLIVDDLTTEPLKMSGGDITIHARAGLGIGELKDPPTL